MGTVLAISPGIASSVDQQVLSGNETGVLRAQERAIGAEFARPTVTFGGVSLGTRAPEFFERLAGRLQHRAHGRALSVNVENPGQEIVDGDVAPDGLSREPRDEPDQTRARAVRQAELQLRHLHAARDDIDDAAEAARHHGVDGEPHHLDRREHHRIEGGDPIIPRPIAEIARQRAVRVVEKDIGLRTRGKRGRATRGGPDIPGGPRHLGAPRPPSLRAALFPYLPPSRTAWYALCFLL